MGYIMVHDVCVQKDSRVHNELQLANLFLYSKKMQRIIN